MWDGWRLNVMSQAVFPDKKLKEDNVDNTAIVS